MVKIRSSAPKPKSSQPPSRYLAEEEEEEERWVAEDEPHLLVLRNRGEKRYESVLTHITQPYMAGRKPTPWSNDAQQ